MGKISISNFFPYKICSFIMFCSFVCGIFSVVLYVAWNNYSVYVLLSAASYVVISVIRYGICIVISAVSFRKGYFGSNAVVEKVMNGECTEDLYIIWKYDRAIARHYLILIGASKNLAKPLKNDATPIRNMACFRENTYSTCRCYGL